MGYCLTDTIYALASGAGAAGVAVIRVSGTQAPAAIRALAGVQELPPRAACLRTLRNRRGEVLDKAVVLYFPAPRSFTGEDVAEFHVHGGRGVVQSVLRALSEVSGCRPAERGEFSRRAVIAGKMDLTQAEGLADLIQAETERQRAQALSQLDGALGKLCEEWRAELVRLMAYWEAFIDFPEEDIPASALRQAEKQARALRAHIRRHLDDGRRGERLREGFQIAIVGAPNVGKSSLMNALAQKDVAIVSQIAGTTRDVVEAHLDVSGFPVILADTAGLRRAVGVLEAEGIRRAVAKAEQADLVLDIQDGSVWPQRKRLPKKLAAAAVLTVWNKADLMARKPRKALCVSAKTGAGIGRLWQEITDLLERSFAGRSAGCITRERYRVALQECLRALENALRVEALELKAEELRLAARALGRITGRVDAEELLDVIFKDFCIGK